jgi:anti-sigma factor RsiW
MTFRRSGSHPEELISASLTGDLTDGERLQLDEHLATCESCRATLAAFANERRLVSGLAHAPAPQDLSARVRGGIERGRYAAAPWWRRPGRVVAIGASLATVAAAILAVVVLGNLRPGPVGHATPSPSASALPSASVPALATPSVEATLTPVSAITLGPGEIGYLSLNGASLAPGRLTFSNEATGASLSLGTVSGPPIAASLSPDGRWLAYITQKGLTGANEVWVAHLTDGSVVSVGCSAEAPFTDRLAWSPNSSYMAYTLVSIDLGPTSGCPANVTAAGRTDAWFFDVGTGERTKITGNGNAFAASFLPNEHLLISWAADTPWSEEVPLNSDATPEHINGVFMPLISPDGNRALFWSGTMASSADGSWQFSRGGMPQLSGDFRSAGPASPWIGSPLFTDLTPVGGEGFAYGSFEWAPDSDQIAFWNGAWTGPPQSAHGTYPSQEHVCAGSSSGLLSAASCSAGPAAGGRIVDVTLTPYGALAVTVGLPSAGIGDPPSATLTVMSASFGGETRLVGGGVVWNGPAVFGP